MHNMNQTKLPTQQQQEHHSKQQQHFRALLAMGSKKHEDEEEADTCWKSARVVQLLRNPEGAAGFATESHAGRVFPACGRLGEEYGQFLFTLEAFAIRRAAVPFEQQHRYEGRAKGMQWQVLSRPAHRQRWELNEGARWSLWWGALKNLLSHAVRVSRTFQRFDRDRVHFAIRAHWNAPPQGWQETDGVFKQFSLEEWDA